METESGVDQTQDRLLSPPHIMPIAGAPRPARPSSATYVGGPVMSGTVTLYYIFYGNWAGNTGLTILPDWARSVGGSPYWDINTLYTDTTGANVWNSVAFGGYVAATGSLSINDSDVATIVSNTITSGSLPKDSNSVYFVLTSPDVDDTDGFCTRYCGWHNHQTVAGTDIKYGFIGNFARCPNSCTAPSPSPNDNPGVDGMMTAVAHELMETVTDPDLNAWIDENGDLCNFYMGDPVRDQYTVANGARANQHLGSRDYLIQQNFLPHGGQCAPRYDRKDIDNNLTTDLLIHNGDTGETQAWYMNGVNRTGFDNLDPLLNLPDSQPWRLLGVGDFNQDGHPDILAHNVDSGAFQAWYMDGINRTSWGDFDPYLSVPDSTGWRVVGIADFNHDGRVDIIIHNGVTGETQIWYMNGINRTSFDNFDGSLNVADSSGWRPVGTGDFNLDGQVDLLWHNGDTGEIQVWYMNGIVRTSFDNFDPYFNMPDSTGWRLVGTDDYNFDGRPDLLWHNGDTGGTQAWYMNGINRTDFADFDPYLSIPDSGGWRFLNPTQ